MASATLLFPQPFGPTMAVTPLSKASSDRSENDLNPLISRRSRRIRTPPRLVRLKPDPTYRHESTSQWTLGTVLSLAGRQTGHRPFRSALGRLAQGEPIGDLSLARQAAPGRKTVVSVPRPSYSGKINLQHNLWGLAQWGSCPNFSAPSSDSWRARARSVSALRRTC